MPTILVLAVAVLAVAALLASRGPDGFRVGRRSHIDAPAAQVDPLISNLRRFMTRNPFAMEGSPFIAKLMGLLFDTDRMVGRELESGLASLKVLAESAGASKAA